MKNSSNRRYINVAVCFLLLSNMLQFTRAYADDERAFTTQITVNVNDPQQPFNPLLLGSNLEWNNRGDSLLAQNGRDFASSLLTPVLELGPTLLRFPGGTAADLFQWSQSIGSSRGAGRLPGGATQPYSFGIDEFLQLTSALGAKRLYTANVVTAPASDAANLAQYVSSKGGIDYWEIGNEPYLSAQSPIPSLTPTQFAANASATIKALRQVVPNAVVGIPLRSDTLNGVPITPYPGYNDAVLSNLTEPFNFVSIHTAYMPIAYAGAPDDNALYLAMVAASATVAIDMAATRAKLAHYFPEKRIPLCFTEYNALVSLGAKQDSLLASLAGALFVADALRIFAEDGDVLFANFWSLADNWYFGAVDRNGNPRPAYYVLRSYRALANGTVLPARVTGPEFDAPSVGFAVATHAPYVVALPVQKAGNLYVALLNRHQTASAKIHLQAEGILNGSGKLSTLSGPEYFAGAEGRPAVIWQENIVSFVQPDVIDIELPPHSFNFLEVPFREPGLTHSEDSKMH